MKNFVKALYTNSPAFSFLCENFPSLSTEKVKTGIFIGPNYVCSPETLNLISLSLSDDHKAAWNAFRHDATGFLRNVKAIHFRKLVDDLITSYEKLLCNMSLKMHFLPSHLDSFLVNCCAYVTKTLSIYTRTSQR